jgi:hypothetical protein
MWFLNERVIWAGTKSAHTTVPNIESAQSGDCSLGEISGSQGSKYEDDCLLDDVPCSLVEGYRGAWRGEENVSEVLGASIIKAIIRIT